MSELPASPIPPAEFFEEWLPAAFTGAELPEEMRAVEFALGVRLEGEGGGEWLFRMVEGALRVEAASRETAAFTVVQTVADWRGALWEGRGGAIGQHAASVFRPGGLAAATGGSGLGPAPSPAALAELRGVEGLLRVVVTGAEGGDWAVGFKLGPGAIPEEPTTTITLTDADATALGTGALDPIEAFMAGRIRIEGDVGLMMQLQAAQMQAAARRGSGG